MANVSARRTLVGGVQGACGAGSGMGMCSGQLKSSDCTRKAMSAELARARLQQVARGWLARRGVEKFQVRYTRPSVRYRP
eukprot:5013456-Prymnesium_polylepis.1